MSTVTIEVDSEIHARIAVCIAARDEGMAQAEDADRTGWNRSLIDQAIKVLADTGQPFSANDLRVLLPSDIPGGLMGARFHKAANDGLIRFVGWVRSTKPNTHGKPVGQYIGRISD